MNRNCWSQKLGLGVAIVILAGLFFCNLAKAASSVSLEWIPNSDPSVAGYNIYYGGASRNYTNVLSSGNSTNVLIDGLAEGQMYYFAVTAYDDFGDESDYSAETVYIVPGLLTLTPGTNPGDPIHIRFPVASDHWYELQASPDLQNWTTVWQVVGFSNMWVQYDAPVNSPGAQFFRVVLH